MNKIFEIHSLSGKKSGQQSRELQSSRWCLQVDRGPGQLLSLTAKPSRANKKSVHGDSFLGKGGVGGVRTHCSWLWPHLLITATWNQSVGCCHSVASYASK